jgi:ketosteroid isomerase-like protein
MSSPEENIKLATDAINAYNNGDLETTLAFVGPEMETQAANNLVNTGRYYGRDGFLEWTAEWLEAWETWEQEVENYEAVGERHVVADVHQKGVGRGSGVPVEMKLAYMFEIRDGQGQRLHLYASRADAIEAAKKGEPDSSA